MSTRRQRRRHHSNRQPRVLAQPQSVSTPLGIIGFAGDQTPWSWIGLTPGEYNPDLSGKSALDTYHRMLTNDSQIRGIARILDVPIRAAKWRIEPAAARTTLDLQIADFVEDNLFNGMAVTWDDALRQMLAARMFGFAVLEKEFSEVDGQIRLVGLWDRLQTTIERFIYGNNRVSGVVQYGTDDTGATRTVTIPGERLVITTYEGSGGNAAGTPLLRPMYMPWYVKHPVIKLIGIGLENSLVGTVWAQVPRSMSDTDRVALRNAIEDLRVRDATGFVLDADVVLQILEGSRNPLDAMPLIEYLDGQMAKVALTQMMELGMRQSGSGSRAVGDVQSIHFLAGENADANMIEDTVNRFVIPQLVNYNWPGYHDYPKLRHADINRIMNLASVGDALNKISTGGLLTWTPDVENTVRDWYDMDPLPDGFQRPQAPALPGQQQAPATAPSAGHPATDSPSGETDPNASDDERRNTERITVRSGSWAPTACTCAEHQQFAGVTPGPIGSMFDQVGDDFQSAAAECLQAMIDHLQQTAQPLLERLAADGPLAAARIYPTLARLALPRRREFLQAVREYLHALVDGARQAAAEIQGEAPPPISDDLERFLEAQALVLADRIPEQLRSAYIQSIVSGSPAGFSTQQLVDVAAQAARDRANVDFRQAFTDAITSLVARLPEIILQPAAGAGDPPQSGDDVA